MNCFQLWPLSTHADTPPLPVSPYRTLSGVLILFHWFWFIRKNCYFVSTPGRFVALRIWDAGHNTAFSPFFSAVTVLKREKFVLLRVIPQGHARTALILASGTVHSEAALLLCLALTGYSRPRSMGCSLPVPKASLDSLHVRRPAQPLPTRHCRWHSYCVPEDSSLEWRTRKP